MSFSYRNRSETSKPDTYAFWKLRFICWTPTVTELNEILGWLLSQVVQIVGVSETYYIFITSFLIWLDTQFARITYEVGCRPAGLVGGVRRCLCLVLLPIGCVSGLFLWAVQFDWTRSAPPCWSWWDSTISVASFIKCSMYPVVLSGLYVLLKFNVMSGICHMFCHSRPRCRCLIGFLHLVYVMQPVCLTQTLLELLGMQYVPGVLWPKL